MHPLARLEARRKGCRDFFGGDGGQDVFDQSHRLGSRPRQLAARQGAVHAAQEDVRVARRLGLRGVFRLRLQGASRGIQLTCRKTVPACCLHVPNQRLKGGAPVLRRRFRPGNRLPGDTEEPGDVGARVLVWYVAFLHALLHAPVDHPGADLFNQMAAVIADRLARFVRYHRQPLQAGDRQLGIGQDHGARSLGGLNAGFQI